MDKYALDVAWAAGHGGKDPGAVAQGHKEKDYNLEGALYCHARSLEMGWRSGLIRRDDSYMNLETMASRVVVSRAKICLCIHVNSNRGHGYEAYHSLRHSPKFAQAVADQLRVIGLQAHGGSGVKTKESQKYKGKDFYRMHYTGYTETIIVEPGFIDDPDFMAFLEAKWQLICESYLQGVSLYLGLPCRAPGAKISPPVPSNLVIIEYKGRLIECEARMEKNRTRGNIGPLLNGIGRSFDWLPAANGQPNRLIIK